MLQDTIEKVVAEKTQEGLDPITLESQITDFITKADSLFKRKVTEIANKLNVEINARTNYFTDRRLFY